MLLFSLAVVSSLCCNTLRTDTCCCEGVRLTAGDHIEALVHNIQGLEILYVCLCIQMSKKTRPSLYIVGLCSYFITNTSNIVQAQRSPYFIRGNEAFHSVACCYNFWERVRDRGGQVGKHCWAECDINFRWIQLLNITKSSWLGQGAYFIWLGWGILCV